MTSRLSLWCAIVALTALTVSQAGAARFGQVREALKQRYPLSRIEVQSLPHQGETIGHVAVLTLEADGVPAKAMRVVQANTKSPRFHVPDYARVELSEQGVGPGEPGDFTLAKGIRLVVLDLKIDADQVRLFTHTAEPVRGAGGQAVYGCTEFVIRVQQPVLERGEVVQVERVIERWLPFAV